MKSKCYILIFLITLLAAALSVSAQSFDSESLNMASDTCRIDDNGNDGNFRDEVTASQAITTPINWDDKMIIPDTAQARAFKTDQRSPYIEFCPKFPEEGFTEFAIDFRADHQPDATYLSVLTWEMSPGSLSNEYANIEEATSAYAGFQILEDGSHAAIMAVWETYAQDSSGKRVRLLPERVYPDNCIKEETFGGEGEGAHCIVPYNWEKSHPYRALLRQGTAPNGNTTIEFWVCDLETGCWTKLVEYDMYRTDTKMNGLAAFLENFSPETAGEFRTMVLSNILVRNAETKAWQEITKAAFVQNFDYPGSYSYGSEGSVFWAATTGLPNMERETLQSNWFTVEPAGSAAPY